MTSRLVVLATGSGSNLQVILDACADGTLEAEGVLVVVNRRTAYAAAGSINGFMDMSGGQG